MCSHNNKAMPLLDWAAKLEPQPISSVTLPWLGFLVLPRASSHLVCTALLSSSLRYSFAQEWLRTTAAVEASWETAWALLQRDRAFETRYFATILLETKIQRTWKTLEDAYKRSLTEQLIAFTAEAFADTQALFLRCCNTLCTLIIKVRSFTHRIASNGSPRPKRLLLVGFGRDAPPAPPAMLSFHQPSFPHPPVNFSSLASSASPCNCICCLAFSSPTGGPRTHAAV